jgi:Na+-transporting NADH:ubiquinone oxidoreductase subunit NqrC
MHFHHSSRTITFVMFTSVACSTNVSCIITPLSDASDTSAELDTQVFHTLPCSEKLLFKVPCTQSVKQCMQKALTGPLKMFTFRVTVTRTAN